MKTLDNWEELREGLYFTGWRPPISVGSPSPPYQRACLTISLVATAKNRTRHIVHYIVGGAVMASDIAAQQKNGESPDLTLLRLQKLEEGFIHEDMKSMLEYALNHRTGAKGLRGYFAFQKFELYFPPFRKTTGDNWQLLK